MQKWIRKSVVVMVSILTFGLITPPPGFLNGNVNAENSSERNNRDSFSESGISTHYLQDERSQKEKFIEEMVTMAELQSYQKFGQKIKPVIENEFRDVVLPNIEKAIQEVATQFPDEDFMHMAISEQPSGGLSEKIFHIENSLTSEDVIRFHVRRDNPPKSGFWFNFHYHTYHDQFQSHHQLGSIFWDKNTPPKWMS